MSKTTMNAINVYIDGSCGSNGQKGAKAGYGVYFAEGDSRNEYGAIEGDKQTNNVGELTAFIRCMEILADEIAAGHRINIYSDSEYVIKCVTKYGDKLHKEGWKTSVPNLELVQKAYTLYQSSKHQVQLCKIKAHTGLQDEHSKGNEGADRLANLGAGKDGDNSIIRLTISYSNKDKAKELGARWDAMHKYWYVNTKYVKGQALEEILKLQNSAQVESVERPQPTGHKNYVKISFADKNKAKALGARWDQAVKSWYYIAGSLSDENIEALLKLQM